MTSVHELIRDAAERESVARRSTPVPGSTPVQHRTIRLQSSEPASCDSGLGQDPWAFDRAAGYGPGASADDAIPGAAPRQGALPARYTEASDAQLQAWIVQAKRLLGHRVQILGHFYQRDEIVQHADFVGDSFMLAQAAKAHPEAEAFVFCGVHFMAETADILSAPGQAVLLPNLAAGCSMADMATIEQVEDCWRDLTGVLGHRTADGRQTVIPVTYMNSSAAIKAFTGERGGLVCTSSNAERALRWAFEQAEDAKVLFLPDQHLGRNTAVLHLHVASSKFSQARRESPSGAPSDTDGSLVANW